MICDTKSFFLVLKMWNKNLTPILTQLMLTQVALLARQCSWLINWYQSVTIVKDSLIQSIVESFMEFLFSSIVLLISLAMLHDIVHVLFYSITCYCIIDNFRNCEQLVRPICCITSTKTFLISAFPTKSPNVSFSLFSVFKKVW